MYLLLLCLQLTVSACSSSQVPIARSRLFIRSPQDSPFLMHCQRSGKQHILCVAGNYEPFPLRWSATVGDKIIKQSTGTPGFEFKFPDSGSGVIVKITVSCIDAAKTEHSLRAYARRASSGHFILTTYDPTPTFQTQEEMDVAKKKEDQPED